MAFEVSMIPPTLDRYILVRSDGIHGLGTKADALPPRIDPWRPRMDRVCLRLLRGALRFFLLLRLWCVRRLDLLLLRLALVRLPLTRCLRPDFLVTGILRGIVYAEIITKNNIILAMCEITLHRHVSTCDDDNTSS
jgi:hypothetical protein